MDGVWTSASRKRGSLGTRALLLPESTKARPRTSFRGLAPPKQMPLRGRARPRRGRRPASRRSGASTLDSCGALKSRARPRSSPSRNTSAAGARARTSTPPSISPASPRRRRPASVWRRRRGGALDAVRHARPRRPLDDVRTRCVDDVGRVRERAPSTAWGLAAMLSTRASASTRDGLCRAAPTAPERRGGPSRRPKPYGITVRTTAH